MHSSAIVDDDGSVQKHKRLLTIEPACRTTRTKTDATLLLTTTIVNCDAAKKTINLVVVVAIAVKLSLLVASWTASLEQSTKAFPFSHLTMRMDQRRLVGLCCLWTTGVAFQTSTSSRVVPSPPFTINDNSHYYNVLEENRPYSLSSSSQSSSQLLLSSSNPSSNNENNGGRRRFRFPRGNPFRGIVKKIVSAQARTWARFRALSKRAQKIVLAQFLIFVFAVSAMTKSVYVNSMTPTQRPIEIAYSSFIDLIEQQQRQKSSSASNDQVPVLDHVRVGSDRIVYRLYRRGPSSTLPLPSSVTKKMTAKNKKTASPQFVTAYTKKVAASPELLSLFRKHDISFSAAPQPRTSIVALSVRSFMVVFYFVILWRLYQNISGASGNSSKDAPGKLATVSDLPMASFEDIQGIDTAKTEVMELVDALRHPEKYAILGARAPTGLLLEGPPGTGKTMLARATAASAGVPLIYCSGSDFVEMFVGRGAARVRKLFERAEKLSPCIIFIDELDALGKSRDSGFGAGTSLSRSNDEAEQTLNQLLACMDGLDSSRRICVLAATNRKEVLDQALIRPGRFDRIVKLKLPDSAGREKILRVHCRKLPGFTEGTGIDASRPGALGKGRVVDLSAIAAVTDGFSGAELEFLVNEAAIRAVRRVSSALREGAKADDITPHVEAADFEASLLNFYETRKPKGGVSEVWKNVFR